MISQIHQSFIMKKLNIKLDLNSFPCIFIKNYSYKLGSIISSQKANAYYKKAPWNLKYTKINHHFLPTLRFLHFAFCFHFSVVLYIVMLAMQTSNIIIILLFQAIWNYAPQTFFSLPIIPWRGLKLMKKETLFFMTFLKCNDFHTSAECDENKTFCETI